MAVSQTGWLQWRQRGGSWRKAVASACCRPRAQAGGSPRPPQRQAPAEAAALAWAWQACSRCARQQRRRHWPRMQLARPVQRARHAAASAARASSRWGCWAMLLPWRRRSLGRSAAAAAPTIAVRPVAAQAAGTRRLGSWRPGRLACGASSSASSARRSSGSMEAAPAPEPALPAALPALAYCLPSLPPTADAAWLPLRSGGRRRRRRARCCKSRMRMC